MHFHLKIIVDHYLENKFGDASGIVFGKLAMSYVEWLNKAKSNSNCKICHFLASGDTKQISTPPTENFSRDIIMYASLLYVIVVISYPDKILEISYLLEKQQNNVRF